MAGSDHKFWIGISSAFILPTLAYVYTQGMTAQSIEQLAKSVEKIQTTVDNVNGQMINTANNSINNTNSILSISKNIDRLEIASSDQTNRLTIIETKINRGK